MLTYNLRGHAGTEGKWTLNNSVEDLIEGVNFLTRRYDFANKERICVIGHSTGALITLLASLKDKRIKFGSIVTTVTSLTDSYLHWFHSGFNREVKDFFKTKGIISPIIDRFTDDPKMLDLYRENKIPESELAIPHRYGMLRSDHFGEFFHEIAYSVNVINLADQLTLPLLLFRGEYDEVMDVRKTNELYERLDKKTPSKLYVTKSKNHFHNDSWDLIQSETLRFFDAFCDYKPVRPDIRRKDILIIDDETLITKTLTGLLRKEGYANVTAVNSGEEALRAISDLMARRQKEFDLIVTDIRMSGLDGIETIRRIKEVVHQSDGRQSPVIFMTGYGGDRTQKEAEDLGYVDFLYKPFNIDDFLMTVRKHLV